jgi:thioredoxin reductase
MKIFDVVIIGAGPAGTSAARELTSKGLSVLLLEKGKPLSKRKDLISGWFGQGISQIGRFETKDILNTPELNESLQLVKQISKQKILKKQKYCNFSYETGHNLAKFFYNEIKTDILFDSEVYSLIKDGNYFRIKFSGKEIFSKKCLITTGRYSIEWIQELTKKLEIDSLTPKAKMGVRVELSYSKLKNDLCFEENNTMCEDVRINSTVGEWEDSHIISAFGYSSPETLKRTNVMVGIIGDLNECIRNTKIINVLTNDKIKKEKVKDFFEKKSILQNLSTFNDLEKAFNKMEELIPDFIECAFMYVPEIRLQGILPVDDKMRTLIPNLYGAGECTNKVNNTLGAMASGIIAAKTILKE